MLQVPLGQEQQGVQVLPRQAQLAATCIRWVQRHLLDMFPLVRAAEEAKHGKQGLFMASRACLWQAGLVYGKQGLFTSLRV
jgi:hypothetical protein